ncbi:MAG: hypothetical protein CMJ78_04725 [Planctomycetaceae bacterium]|nr:hypothetical protein [Planctomycetaceae bacterium]
MELHEPTKIYTAASNMQAHEVVAILASHDIKAQAVEDESAVGIWGGGVISQVFKPNIWVGSSDVDEALELIDHFEHRQRELARANDKVDHFPDLDEVEGT